MPIMLNLESRSLMLKYATKGVNTGIVEMITLVIVELTSVNPKLSPKK